MAIFMFEEYLQIRKMFRMFVTSNLKPYVYPL